MAFFGQRLAPCTNLSSSDPFSTCANGSSNPGYRFQNISSRSLADNLSEELWEACAGSLAYVPRVGERVWYFPQGHMEQVTASIQQDSGYQLPIAGRLLSQILCRVIARDLSAEVDTDEVYAKISLAPEPQESLDASAENTQEEAASQPQLKSATRLFVKVLTASDTSTHGGFSVLRKHAEECLPPLDMSQEIPTQELKARDLHGYEWKFRHTYRGHPRRHLLTTGWSLFVSQKKLLAGDAVIFLRGEDGELRVGIRRAKRPQSSPQAVMSRESMHMGVIATALHALSTRTMFSVFFKPRLCFSSFLVPKEKLRKAMSVSLSVGRRLRMHCETENGSDLSLTGIITGIEAMNSEDWPDSKWRSVKVDWDEGDHEYPRRVSPWEIEPETPTLVMNPLSSSLWTKRPRLSSLGLTSVQDFRNSGFDKGFLDGTFRFEMPTALQGQEALDLRTSSLWKSLGHKHHSSSHDSQMQYQHQQEIEMDSMLRKKNLFSSTNFECKASDSSTLHGGSCYSPLIPTCETSVTESIPSSLHSQQENSQLLSEFNSSASVRGSTSVCHPSLNASSSSQAPPMLSKRGHCHSFRAVDPPSAQLPAVTETEVKLFGISLTGTHSEKRAEDQDVLLKMKNMKGPPRLPDLQMLPMENMDAYSDQRRAECSEAEIPSNQPTRSCIKVIKKGSMVGRGIDLSRYEGYAGLLDELEAMFDMKGQLTDPDKEWQVAYSDSEGDTMKVGDDPWPEFCCMVKKLYIISQEEKKGA